MVYCLGKYVELHMHLDWSYARNIYRKLGKDIHRDIFTEQGQRGCEQLKVLLSVCIKSSRRQCHKYLQLVVRFCIAIFCKHHYKVFVSISLSIELNMKSWMAYHISYVKGIMLHPWSLGFYSSFQSYASINIFLPFELFVVTNFAFLKSLFRQV